jgi:hypothetical protein
MPLPRKTPFVPSSRDLAKGAPGEAIVSQRDADPPTSRPRRQIWDLEQDGDTCPEDAAAPGHAAEPDQMPEPEAPGEDMASRARRALATAERRAQGRGIAPPSGGESGDTAKTRVLGFHAPDLETDPISAVAHKAVVDIRYPAGWLVVVDGPGRGAFFAVTMSVSSIGRGEDQSIPLNFGDASISRQNHAAIAYDAEQNRFFLGHGNKSNIVRRNGQPVLATEELFDGDVIRIGKTSLRFVALCGEDFTWGDIAEEDGTAHE